MLVPSSSLPSPPVIIDPISVERSKSGEYSESEVIEGKSTPVQPSLKDRIAAYLSLPDHPPSNPAQSPPTPPTPPSISQRSKAWLQQREHKLKSMSSSPTVTPVIYTQIPHHLHKLTAESLIHFAADAKSQGKSGETTTRGPKPAKDRRKRPGFVGKTLTPVVRHLSFSSGCDWDSLQQRQKSQRVAYS